MSQISPNSAGNIRVSATVGPITIAYKLLKVFRLHGDTVTLAANSTLPWSVFATWTPSVNIVIVGIAAFMGHPVSAHPTEADCAIQDSANTWRIMGGSWHWHTSAEDHSRVWHMLPGGFGIFVPAGTIIQGLRTAVNATASPQTMADVDIDIYYYEA
jgi:hypothetical protein